MTDYSELIAEALWSLESLKDRSESVSNAIICLQAASVKHGQSRKRQTKSKSGSRKKRKKKKAVQAMSLQIRGLMPRGMKESQLRGALIPLLDDFGCRGEYIYSGWTRMNNGTRCFNLFGWCPIHQKAHRQAKFQVKQHMRQEWCVVKCWKGDRIIKTSSVPELNY